MKRLLLFCCILALVPACSSLHVTTQKPLESSKKYWLTRTDTSGTMWYLLLNHDQREQRRSGTEFVTLTPEQLAWMREIEGGKLRYMHPFTPESSVCREKR